MASSSSSSSPLQSLLRLCFPISFSFIIIWFTSPASPSPTPLKLGYQIFYPYHNNTHTNHGQVNAHLNLNKTSHSSKLTSPPGSWSIPIHHRDSVSASRLPAAEVYSNPPTIITASRLSRDSARVSAITRLLGMASKTLQEEEEEGKGHDKSDEDHHPKGPPHPSNDSNDFESPVVSGLRVGSGEYFARIGVGTPPARAFFVMDTGSDLSWTQCQPCRRCYVQSDPFYDPSSSSSFQDLDCVAPMCSQLHIQGCTHSNQCTYEVTYGDGSFTIGRLALETLTFGRHHVPRIAFGCGHDNEGLFLGASGLLGLGAGPLAFPSQAGLKFSYCLADRFRIGSGAGRSKSELVFGGSHVAPFGSIFTPLRRNPKLKAFYYVELRGISVGGRRLPILSSVFALQSNGTGGMIVDSGTSITRLRQPAYMALRDEFMARMPASPIPGRFSLFDTCYALGAVSSVSVPTIHLHFAGDATLELPVSNYLIPIDTSGTFCLGFAGTNGALSILGNVQQQGYLVSFDKDRARIGFSPNQC